MILLAFWLCKMTLNYHDVPFIAGPEEVVGTTVCSSYGLVPVHDVSMPLENP